MKPADSRTSRTARLARPLLLALACGTGLVVVAHALPGSPPIVGAATTDPASASTAPASPSSAALAGEVELSPTPPNQTQAVSPNIAVTFDDSGSMKWTKMGDFPPYTTQTYGKGTTSTNYDWGGANQPWRCAAVINPAATSGIGTSAMNGVYYNPNVVYTPPLYEDGTSFPNADATLAKVPVDGIAIKRPTNSVTPAAAGYWNNPDLNGTANDNEVTNLTGTGSNAWSCGGSNLNYSFAAGYGTTGQSDGWGTVSNSGYGGYGRGGGNTFTPATSPFAATGGPYYYQFKSALLKSITVNATTGVPDSAGLSVLYNPNNWEPVQVTNTALSINGKTVTDSNGNTVTQYQNFANWYAYYRTRNLMARTALSRVFGAIGTTKSSSVRVAWQNLGNNTGGAWPDCDSSGSNCNFNALYGLLQVGTTIIAPLDDTTTYTQSDGTSVGYRKAFFNWIFNVVANNGTPSRDAVANAGQFFSSGNGVTDATNPYWQENASGSGGQELACRQNFSMLVTDGYWNADNNAQSATNYKSTKTATTLGDGSTTYSPSSSGANPTTIYYGAGTDGSGNKTDNATMSNIAFNYWATNLRPDLATSHPQDRVAAYFPDLTVGVAGPASPVPAVDLTNPGATPEIYWNPANDPATWPHMDDFYVTLGAGGLLNSQPTDTDCTMPGFDGNTGDNDNCNLRKGTTNASGSVGWPTPNGNANGGNGEAQNVDDMWHAALNSRGAFFVATSPQALVDRLNAILTSITDRTAAPATNALNTSVLVPGALAFSTGYNTTNWSGTLQAVQANPDGTVGTTLLWNKEAGAQLANRPLTGAGMRQILTSTEDGSGTFNGGIPFESTSTFDTAAQKELMLPASTDTTNDTLTTRINYLRGDRTEETGVMRSRTSLLGAIIDSQAVYVAYPASGYQDSWPSGSSEATAAASGNTNDDGSYEQFIKNHLSREPAVYVGANDGMLHAFDAPVLPCTATDPSTGDCTAFTKNPNGGKELFAYVPRSAYANLGNLTRRNFTFMPTVDGTPVTRDVFFDTALTSPAKTTAGWHTILVGNLRNGGRGIYALDITDPTTVTEATAGSSVLWEFSADETAATSGCVSNYGTCDPADLGFTYGQPNIGRLATGKWVVLVPGGYFPDCSKAPYTATNCPTPQGAPTYGSPEVAYSSLFVLDAQTGAMIAELKTPTNLTTSAGATISSSGLSSPVLGDYNNDQVDDVAFAGDLNGNLWRYNLTSTDPSSWTVSLAYEPAKEGTQPITSMPRLFPDPATNRFIVVFGTGKYLGAHDNVSGSETTQSIYGIRDLLNSGGTGPAAAVVGTGNLQQQTLAEQSVTAGGVTNVARGDTNIDLTTAQSGWYIDLDLTSSPGERVVVTPGALFDTNRVIITTLIPSSSDPCVASITGAVMVLNATTGGSGGGLSTPSYAGWSGSNAYRVVGGLVNNPPTSGTVPVATVVGGGSLLIPGLPLNGGGTLKIDDAVWRRRSWGELDNDQ